MMPDVYVRHDAVLRTAVSAYRGVVYKTIGDAFQAAFPSAPRALAAALRAQRRLVAEDWDGGGLPEPLRIREGAHRGRAAERGRAVTTCCFPPYSGATGQGTSAWVHGLPHQRRVRRTYGTAVPG